MTSLEVAYDPKAPPSPSAFAPPAGESETEQERRWAAWLAKGREREVRLRRRMGWFGIAVVTLVTWTVWVLAR